MPKNKPIAATLPEIDKKIEELTIEKNLLYEKLATSNNVDEIMKAAEYQTKKKTTTAETTGNAYIFAPDNEYYNGLGYKSTIKSVPFEYLRSMGRTPFIFSVISTRINQILEFSNFQTEMDRPGWTIRRRQSRFDKEQKITDKDKVIIEKIAEFVENGGVDAKFTIHNDFHDFLKVFPKDLLELDQGVFEVQRTRAGDLLSYDCVDSGTIRLLETIDPNFTDQQKYEELMFKGHKYLPHYCQVWRERLLENPKTKQDIIWYPWEMCFSVRNKSSNIWNNGYGVSELEILLRVVTWTLESMEYNGRFFTNGSNPRGFFTMKGGVDPRMLNDFRTAWRSMVTGWQNAHKIPVFEAEKIEWVNMQNSNKEMEFAQWLEFLTLITCSVYKIDPSEMGFRFKQQGSIFGESGQKDRLDHSKDKGLKPILKTIEKAIDKYIVSELDERYEFRFTGIDIEDEQAKLDADVKKLANGMVSMQDKFKQYSGRDFDPDKDIILNSAYLQSKQMQQYGGQGANQQVDEMNGGEDEGAQNPFADYEKGISSDPIMKEVLKYAEQQFGHK